MRISGKFNEDKNVRKSSRDSGPPSRRHSNVRRLSTPQNKTQVELLKLSSRKKENWINIRTSNGQMNIQRRKDPWAKAENFAINPWFSWRWLPLARPWTIDVGELPATPPPTWPSQLWSLKVLEGESYFVLFQKEYLDGVISWHKFRFQVKKPQ